MNKPTSYFLRTDFSDGVLVLFVASKQLRDIGAVADFARELRQFLQTRTERFWLLDFGNTTFFITPAANTLLAVMQQLRQRGGDLSFTGVTDDLRYVLALLRLDGLFAIYPCVPDALAEMKRSAQSAPAAAEAG
jgi:anti-anti-sigma regulatory factor